MTDMEPVAWMADSGTCVTNEAIISLPYQKDYYRTPLYTEAQLKQARAEALREAAENVDSCGYISVEELRRMADEVSK